MTEQEILTGLAARAATDPTKIALHDELATLLDARDGTETTKLAPSVDTESVEVDEPPAPEPIRYAPLKDDETLTLAALNLKASLSGDANDRGAYDVFLAALHERYGLPIDTSVAQVNEPDDVTPIEQPPIRIKP